MNFNSFGQMPIHVHKISFELFKMIILDGCFIVKGNRSFWVILPKLRHICIKNDVRFFVGSVLNSTKELYSQLFYKLLMINIWVVVPYCYSENSCLFKITLCRS
jgi:hypothetical protein